jgi:hypothetical protein
LGKSFIPVWTPSLLMRLITQVTSLDTSSMLLKRFPRIGFFIFGNKSKSGGLSPLCFITAVQRLGKSCIPVWTPSLLMRLITQVASLDTSSMLLKHFPPSGFFKQAKVFDLFPKLKKPLRGKRFRSTEEVYNEVT